MMAVMAMVMAVNPVVITLHQGFATIEAAIDVIEKAMWEQCQPMRRESKELVRNFNKKCHRAERQIMDLGEDAQYSQR